MPRNMWWSLSKTLPMPPLQTRAREAESARIIRTAADKLEEVFAPAQNEEFPLRDLNGNKVGQATGGVWPRAKAARARGRRPHLH